MKTEGLLYRVSLALQRALRAMQPFRFTDAEGLDAWLYNREKRDAD